MKQSGKVIVVEVLVLIVVLFVVIPYIQDKYFEFADIQNDSELIKILNQDDVNVVCLNETIDGDLHWACLYETAGLNIKESDSGSHLNINGGDGQICKVERQSGIILEPDCYYSTAIGLDIQDYRYIDNGLLIVERNP